MARTWSQLDSMSESWRVVSTAHTWTREQSDDTRPTHTPTPTKTPPIPCYFRRKQSCSTALRHTATWTRELTSRTAVLVPPLAARAITTALSVSHFLFLFFVLCDSAGEHTHTHENKCQLWGRKHTVCDRTTPAESEGDIKTHTHVAAKTAPSCTCALP